MSNKAVQGLGKNDKGIYFLPNISCSKIDSALINTKKIVIDGIDYSDSIKTGSSAIRGSDITGSVITNTTIGSVDPLFGRFTTLDVVNNLASTSSATGSITTLGGISINHTTDASSFTNGGSFTTAGGMSIAKKLYVGGDVNINSAIFMNSTGAAINLGNYTTSNNPVIVFYTSNTGSAFLYDAKIQAYGGTGVGNTATLEFDAAKYKFGSSGYTTLEYVAPSTSPSTGAVVSAGGIGINITTDAVSSSNGGTLTTAGGVGIAKKLFVGSSLTVETNSDGYIKFPSLTAIQRDALTASAGMMIFNSDSNQMNYFNGTSWTSF